MKNKMISLIMPPMDMSYEKSSKILPEQYIFLGFAYMQAE